MSLELVRTVDTSALDVVAEANHRIANHLAMIAGLMRSQGARIFEKQETMTGREVRLTLEEFAARLETVARVHRMLSQSDEGEPVDVDAYLRSIAERMLSSLSLAGEMKLHCDLRASCVLSSEKAITLGLLVGELMARHGLQPRQDQIRKAVESIAQNYENPSEVIQWYLGSRERLAEIEAGLTEDNVVSWALARARVKEVAVPFDELMGGRK